MYSLEVLTHKYFIPYATVANNDNEPHHFTLCKINVIYLIGQSFCKISSSSN